MYPEEYEAVSTFSPSSLMNMSWPADPHCPSHSPEEHSGPFKATAVPAYIPVSFLAQVGCGKSSADVFVLAPGYARDANTPGLLLIQNLLPAGHLLMSWHSLTLEGTLPPSPSFSSGWWGSVGVARCTHIPLPCSLQQPKAIIAPIG